MPELTASDIVRLFEEDEKARKNLAELLVSEPDIRLAIINAVLRDVATRRDVEELRKEISSLHERVSRMEGVLSQFVERIGDLDKRIDSLDKRIDALDKRIDFIAKIVILLTGSVLATLIANIMLRLLAG